MTELALPDIAPELSEREQMFLYQLELVGMSVKRAAEVAGVASPYALLKRPNIAAAREKYRETANGRVDFTRDDIVAGFKKAIDQAYVLADPMAQIAGWREIAKMKGYDKTPQVNINLKGDLNAVQNQLQQMSTEQLLELAGRQIDFIDADFYAVKKEDDESPDALAG